MATFFSIRVPGQDGRAWADDHWDTYGFDYDKSKCGNGFVTAWPLEDHGEDDLRAALEADGIDYFTFEIADVDAFFG